MTHTYVTMDISLEAFNEIRKNLLVAEYHHAILNPETLDMHGIAVQVSKDFDHDFRNQLDWFMCSDPWPTTLDLHKKIETMLDEKSKFRGYSNWIDAFHKYNEVPDDLGAKTSGIG